MYFYSISIFLSNLNFKKYVDVFLQLLHTKNVITYDSCLIINIFDHEKKNAKEHKSSQNYYDFGEQCVLSAVSANNHLNVTAGMTYYWRSFCMGSKDAALELLDFFYECKCFPLAYTFYKICMLIKHPKCSEYKDKMDIEKTAPYLKCATSVYHHFMTARDIIGQKSITDSQNIDLSVFYYNNIIMPDGTTLSHAVLSKLDAKWDDGLIEVQNLVAPHFYDCSIEMLLFKCMHFSDEDDNTKESSTLMGGQDDNNSGCCCIVM